MILIGVHNPVQNSLRTSIPTDRSSTGCNFIRYSPVRVRADEEPYGMEWDLCYAEDSPQHYVKIERKTGAIAYAFEPADEISQLERMDFDNDGNEELLYVSTASGTGNDLEWCVLGWINDGLKCWEVPDVRMPSEKLLKNDEDFCCKDWSLKVTAGNIVLGRGIYRKGEGNCCPSRGGVFVELVPQDGEFRIAKVWRGDSKTYHTWLFSR